MIPKLVFKALRAVATNPELRRRVMATAGDPEVRRQLVEKATKGVESLRQWWLERESRTVPNVPDQVVPPDTSAKKTAPTRKPKKPASPRKQSS